jgi:uncharacterized protein YfaQ (DUF2300 family)
VWTAVPSSQGAKQIKTLVLGQGLTAEAAQLEADQRTQEDWQRRQQDAWLRNRYGTNGYWTGLRSWQPDQMKAGW